MSPRLLALSDLHVRHKVNRAAIEALPEHPEDWLILAGDLGENLEQVGWVFEALAPRFARLLWVPGNHELWSDKESGLFGQAKYEALVALCREHGVDSPEDPYPRFEGDGGPARIAPLFVGYDYSFAPDGMSVEEALAWSSKQGIVCTDEWRLRPDPFESRQAWCRERVRISEARLGALDDGLPTVLVNHWPLRGDLCRLPAIPTFRIWCGTTATEDWHTRFGGAVVVSGHLHLRRTDWRDGTRFEEVSLGYPRHWRPDRGAEAYLREILPGPRKRPWSGLAGPIFHR